MISRFSRGENIRWNVDVILQRYCVIFFGSLGISGVFWNYFIVFFLKRYRLSRRTTPDVTETEQESSRFGTSTSPARTDALGNYSVLLDHRFIPVPQVRCFDSNLTWFRLRLSEFYSLWLGEASSKLGAPSCIVRSSRSNSIV